jgi:sarcosine oxidase subunit beta
MHLDSNVVIVGAGLVGSSVAMHLAALGVKDITVLDLDLAGDWSSSELNAGGVRATWHHPINGALSRISIDYFETVAKEVGFLQKGYFWMYGRDQWDGASRRLQQNQALAHLGIEYLSPEQVSTRFDFLDRVTDLGGATFSPKDGLINPNLLKLHFRSRAEAGGVVFANRYWVHGVTVDHQTHHVNLRAWQLPAQMTSDQVKEFLSTSDASATAAKALEYGAKEVTVSCRQLVNCTGPWARKFAHAMGINSWSHAVRRQISFFECRDVNIKPYGMFVDSSGVYFHAEGEAVLSGYAVPNETYGYCYDYDGEEFFNENIWPALYKRSSRFEQLKHVSGWSGLYEVSPDHSAIVGRVPGFEMVYEAHSFSGRGAMQSYAAGLALAETMVYGESRSVFIEGLDSGRFDRGEKVSEDLII